MPADGVSRDAVNVGTNCAATPTATTAAGYAPIRDLENRDATLVPMPGLQLHPRGLSPEDPQIASSIHAAPGNAGIAQGVDRAVHRIAFGDSSQVYPDRT